MNINTILQQYHQKFDDNEVRELLEKLESMMYERASFFSELINTYPEFEEQTDDYWRELDDLGYGSEPHNEILDKLRNDVKGLAICWCCKKMGIIKPKIMQSVLSDKMYLVKLCENCITKSNWVVQYKEKVNADTPIPSTLPEEEKQLMIKYQKRRSIDSIAQEKN